MLQSAAGKEKCSSAEHIVRKLVGSGISLNLALNLSFPSCFGTPPSRKNANTISARSGVVESSDQAADLVPMIRFNLKLSSVL
jgi:hypothetical protein